MAGGGEFGARIRAAAAGIHPCLAVGRTFWFKRNTLVGSYLSLRVTSRWYVAAPNAERTRSSLASLMKFNEIRHEVHGRSACSVDFTQAMCRASSPSAQIP